MKKKVFTSFITVIMLLSMMVSSAFAAAKSYDAFAEFDTASPTGENGPWLYYVTDDEGATFTPCTVLEEMDGLKPWHPFAGNWTGVGLNADVPDFVELNADGKGGMYGTLSFKAPEDGKYTISVNVKNVWEQPAELLHVRLNGADLFTVEPSLPDADIASFKKESVALKAGEEVFFFCPSTADGGWVSTYLQVVVTAEAADAAVTDTPVTDTATDDTAPATNVPKTGVVGLGLLYGVGAVVTGTLVFKKKSK